MITAEDVAIKRKNLVQNLTLHVHASKELVLLSLNGMLSNEWWHFLNGNEQTDLLDLNTRRWQLHMVSLL